MTQAQKIIKYIAIAFAVFLIVNIISGIVFGIYGVASVIGITTRTKENKTAYLEEITTNLNNEDIWALKIELDYSNLTIKNGDAFKAESNNSDISCTKNNNQIVIKEKNHNWFSKNEANELIVYVPENILFEAIKIETGAGKINIEYLKTKQLYFEIGAGKVEIQNLNVTEKAKIEGGAGKVEILSGAIENLDLDIGIGEFNLTSKLTGNNKLNAGIGKLMLDLIDDIENYTVEVNKGIGSIKIDGKETTNNTKYGNGVNNIKIDGGIGSIVIK